MCGVSQRSLDVPDVLVATLHPIRAHTRGEKGFANTTGHRHYQLSVLSLQNSIGAHLGPSESTIVFKNISDVTVRTL